MECCQHQCSRSWLLSLLLVLLCCFQVCLSSSGRGWGDEIKWKSYQDGLLEAKSNGKPMMLIIHKTWCGACKALKPKFRESLQISALSNLFVMVNAEDEEEPMEKQFHIDGGYIPRIFFLDATGTVIKEFYNTEGNLSYKYFYSSAEQIASTMKKVIANTVNGIRVGDEL